MALTSQQIGKIGEMECAKHIMIGSEGLAVTLTPEIDDEQRDIEVHLKYQVTAGISIQCKVSTGLFRRPFSNLLDVWWNTPKEDVFAHPRFWYFLAHLDLKQRALTDPVFLIPSGVVNRYAHRRNWKRLARFQLRPSLNPKSRDRWSPYRLSTADLGHRVLEIIRDLNARTAPAALAA